jgi:uncharacterized lipoprotein
LYDGKEEMKKFIILIPVYNDWKSVFKLLENIDLQIAEWDAEVFVLIVNDASTEKKNINQIKLYKSKISSGYEYEKKPRTCKMQRHWIKIFNGKRKF